MQLIHYGRCITEGPTGTDDEIARCRYNRYLAVAGRVVRRSLKDDKRLAAERRGEMDLRFAKWEVSLDVGIDMRLRIADGHNRTASRATSRTSHQPTPPPWLRLPGLRRHKSHRRNLKNRKDREAERQPGSAKSGGLDWTGRNATQPDQFELLEERACDCTMKKTSMRSLS